MKCIVSSYMHNGIRPALKNEKSFFWGSQEFVKRWMKELSDPAVAVYIALTWAEQRKTKIATKSYIELTELTGLSRDSVIRGVRELKSKKLIVVKRSSAAPRCNEYQISSLCTKPQGSTMDGNETIIRSNPTDEQAFWWISSLFVTTDSLARLSQSGTALRVLLWLLCIENSQTRISRVSQKALAERIGVHSRSIRRALKKLKELKLIISYRFPFGSGLCNEYRLLALVPPKEYYEEIYFHTLPSTPKPKSVDDWVFEQRMGGSCDVLPTTRLLYIEEKFRVGCHIRFCLLDQPGSFLWLKSQSLALPFQPDALSFFSFNEIEPHELNVELINEPAPSVSEFLLFASLARRIDDNRNNKHRWR